jgi:hypothetical protein
MLSPPTLGQGLVGSGMETDQSLGATGDVVFALGDWAGQAAVAIAFCMGALMFHSAHYRARLVPRWLCGRGLLGANVYLPSAIFAVAGRDDIATLTNIPMTLNRRLYAGRPHAGRIECSNRAGRTL